MGGGGQNIEVVGEGVKIWGGGGGQNIEGVEGPV